MGRQRITKIFLLITLFVFLAGDICYAKYSAFTNILNRIIVNPKSLREEYRFRIGDKIDILTDNNITISTRIDRSGYIVFKLFKPFVIYAKGQTIKEVEDKIQECFEKFYTHISVSLSVEYSHDFILERYIREIYEKGVAKEELTEPDVIEYREAIKGLLTDKTEAPPYEKDK